MSSVPSAPRRLPQHGTVARYNAGCDCRPCRRARADYSTARYQAKRRAQREAQLAQRELVLDAVEEYRGKGWGVFPLPAASKFPPPRGVTGASARPITDADYESWERSWGNVGLVMPDGVVGLDIDAYKHDGRLADDLPPTVRSTSRGDGSGVYLFRVPPGTKLKGDIPGLGEVIQRTHRYAVAAPSLHPEGRIYRWVDDDDNEVQIPSIDDLPRLPEAWLKRLSERPTQRGGKGAKRRTGVAYDGNVDDWLDNLPTGAPSRKVRASLRKTVQAVRRYAVHGDSRYDVMVRGVGALVALGAERHRGVEQALDDVWVEYVNALEGTPDRDPEAELERAISGAAREVGLEVKLYTRSEVRKWKPPTWVIKHVLPEGSINYLLSEWGKGKSFLGLDWAIHIALGLDWQEFRTSQRRVLYVAAEGIPNKRLDAWEKFHQSDITDDLILCPGMTITSHDDQEELERIIDEEDIGVLFLDTQHAVSQGIGENGADDAGEVLAPLQELRREFPDLITVILHHRGKEASRGGRGSSAFPAAMDYIYEIDSEDPKVEFKLRRSKQREEGAFDVLTFRLEVVKLGTDEDGDPITSCVIIESDPIGDADMRTKFVLALQNDDTEWVGTRKLMSMVQGGNTAKHRVIHDMTDDGTLTRKESGNRVMYRLSTRNVSERSPETRY